MTGVLPPTCVTGREQPTKPHEHVAWARGRDEVVTPIERAGRRAHGRVLARAGQPGLGRRRDQVVDIEFALVLTLHQPSGNLEKLLDAPESQAREILWAIDRIPRSLWRYEEIARVHLALSGTLLETLASPDFQHRVTESSTVGRCCGICRTLASSRCLARATTILCCR